jgi:HAMP domain-containing protein
MALPSRPASRPSWPRTLRGRLLALVLGALVVAQIVSFWMFLDERSRAVAYAAAEDAAGRALSLAAALDAAPEPSWPGLLRSAGSRWIRFSVDPAPAATETDWRGLRRLAGRLSRSPAGEGRPLRIAMMEEDAPWADWRRDRDAEDDRRERHPRDDDEEAPRRLLVSAALADGRWLNGVALARRPPLVWAGAALASAGISAVLLTVAIWVAVGRIARPIDALARAADRLGRGDRPDPLPLTGAQEIRSVAGAFNDMADRLTRLLDERARTLAAIGHDLRSPITAMRLRLEMIDDDETRERIAACVDEMQVLVEAALALARGGGAEEALAPTRLTEPGRGRPREAALGRRR